MPPLTGQSTMPLQAEQVQGKPSALMLAGRRKKKKQPEPMPASPQAPVSAAMLAPRKR